MEARSRSGPLDAVAFSGLVPAGVAGALCLACGLVLSAEAALPQLGGVAALAAAGSLVVYDVDRLRDLRRDRTRAPVRTRFVETHRRAMLALTLTAALACIPLALAQPPGVWLLCSLVLALGLWHRRLKGRPLWKIVYVTGAWVAVVVGLPLAATDTASARTTAATTVTLAASIGANLIASNLRERGPTPLHRRALIGARALALAGALVCLIDRATWLLLPIPVAQALALVPYRQSERYALLVIDGALLLGPLVTIALHLATR